jgi:hypothetical protein
MNFNKYVVWGFKNNYHTHSHIHEALYRALKYMGKNVSWLDEKDNTSGMDFSDTLFITEHGAAYTIPLHRNAFYVVHGGLSDDKTRTLLSGYKSVTWNVYHDVSHSCGSMGILLRDYNPNTPELTEKIWIDRDFAFYPNERHMDFRWATDLTPPEIEKNKQRARLLNVDSHVINWVGTFWHVNQVEIAEFKRACHNSNIEFRHFGAGQADGDGHLGNPKVVSIEKNIELVLESYFAPAIVGSHHLVEGYAPCRIFKNISYGQFGVTNSARVNSIFDGKLIFNPDPHLLFYEAQERLQNMKIEELYSLMDEVAEKHTYVNRLNGIFKVIDLLEK